jgi:hypothetical protein
LCFLYACIGEDRGKYGRGLGCTTVFVDKHTNLTLEVNPIPGHGGCASKPAGSRVQSFKSHASCQDQTPAQNRIQDLGSTQRGTYHCLTVFLGTQGYNLVSRGWRTYTTSKHRGITLVIMVLPL